MDASVSHIWQLAGDLSTEGPPIGLPFISRLV
jgi:hypothetical protein